MIRYNFFGKNCLIDRALSDRSGVEESLKNLGWKSESVLFVNQIHGAEVVVIDDKSKIHGTQNLPKADAIVTNQKNIVIGVITADCAPVFLFDEEKEVIAVAHAGWRGAKLGVLESAITAMKNLGAKNILAAIGPMIQKKSYEVSEEFFRDFLSDNLANKKFFIDGVSAGKYWFDLPFYVEEKLHDLGINKIENRQIDTYQNEQDFFSYRRSTHRGEKDCGRNVSVIVVN
jgi:YfiH family protein